MATKHQNTPPSNAQQYQAQMQQYQLQLQQYQAQLQEYQAQIQQQTENATTNSHGSISLPSMPTIPMSSGTTQTNERQSNWTNISNKSSDIDPWEMCYDFVFGQCERGEECPWSHNNNVKTCDNARSWQICWDFSKRGHCDRGDSCQWLHPEKENKNTNKKRSLDLDSSFEKPNKKKRKLNNGSAEITQINIIETEEIIDNPWLENDANEANHKWNMGDKCCIYSQSKNKWFNDGTVVKIFHQNNNEWLEIIYNNSKRQKEIKSNNKKIKYISQEIKQENNINNNQNEKVIKKEIEPSSIIPVSQHSDFIQFRNAILNDDSPIQHHSDEEKCSSQHDDSLNVMVTKEIKCESDENNKSCADKR